MDASPFRLASASSLTGTELRARRLGFSRVVADDPDETLDVNTIARPKIGEFGCSSFGEIKQALVDRVFELRAVTLCERMADACSEVLRHLGLQIHMLVRPPQKRQVSNYGPFRTVVRLQRSLHLKQRRLAFTQRETRRSSNERVGIRPTQNVLHARLFEGRKKIRGTEDCQDCLTEARPLSGLIERNGRVEL